MRTYCVVEGGNRTLLTALAFGMRSMLMGCAGSRRQTGIATLWALGSLPRPGASLMPIDRLRTAAAGEVAGAFGNAARIAGGGAREGGAIGGATGT